MLRTLLLTFSLVILTSVASQAQDWGNLKARFVLEGKAPVPAKAAITKDIEICGKHKIVDETLVVNPANNGIANVVVFLSVKPGGTKPTIHPEYAKTEKADVILDNHNCRFEPHIVIMRTTQKLVIGNKDPMGHNTKADFFTNTSFNDLIPAGGKVVKTLDKPEAAPSPLSCSIHPWMGAKLIIREDPYAAVSDKDGKLEIKNLPTGKWTFTVWQEGCGYITSAKQGGKTVEWKKGKVDIDIKKGDNDLLEIKVPVEVLTKKK